MQPELIKRTLPKVTTTRALFAFAGLFAIAGVVAPKRSPPPTAPAPLSPLAAEAEAVRAEVESLDAQVQDGLAQMGRYLKEFEAERRSWVSLDMTVDAARRVNAALLARNRAVLALYDGRLAEPIGRFRERLKEAPAVYRRLAEERRRDAKQATLDAERKSYELMASLCDSAARLCEQRHREVFEGDTGAPNAIALAQTIANMRKYEVVHARWEDTFGRYPSSLDDRRTAALFAHLSVYAEDLEAFTNGVEALTDAMRRKAAGPQDRSSESDEPYPGQAATAQLLAKQERPATSHRTSLVSTTSSAARPPAETPSDPLQPGAVLEGSLSPDTDHEVPFRLTVVGRAAHRFTARLLLMCPEGTVELKVHGATKDRHVTIDEDGPPMPGRPGFCVSGGFNGEWCKGASNYAGGICNVRFRLAAPGVMTDRVAAVPR